MAYGCRELRKDDWDKIRDFIEDTPFYATILMRGPVHDIQNFKGWWLGSLASGLHLEALACVEGHATNIYSRNTDAIEAVARELLRRARRSSTTHTHQILGSEQIVSDLWRIFRDNPYTVIHDKKRTLFGSSAPAEPLKPDLSIEVATDNDFKVVYEFAADHAVERWGYDPRRISANAHAARCRAAIESGRQLIGRDRGKPVFIAEQVSATSDRILLDRLFVPRPFRVRKKMVSSAVVLTAQRALEGAEEVLFFADNDDSLLVKAAELGGFEAKYPYRLIVMRG